MRIASVDVCLDPGYLVLICTHIIINYLSINVILSLPTIRYNQKSSGHHIQPSQLVIAAQLEYPVHDEETYTKSRIIVQYVYVCVCVRVCVCVHV